MRASASNDDATAGLSSSSSSSNGSSWTGRRTSDLLILFSTFKESRFKGRTDFVNASCFEGMPGSNGEWSLSIPPRKRRALPDASSSSSSSSYSSSSSFSSAVDARPSVGTEVSGNQRNSQNIQGNQVANTGSSVSTFEQADTESYHNNNIYNSSSNTTTTTATTTNNNNSRRKNNNGINNVISKSSGNNSGLEDGNDGGKRSRKPTAFFASEQHKILSHPQSSKSKFSSGNKMNDSDSSDEDGLQFVANISNSKAESRGGSKESESNNNDKNNRSSNDNSNGSSSSINNKAVPGNEVIKRKVLYSSKKVPVNDSHAPRLSQFYDGENSAISAVFNADDELQESDTVTSLTAASDFVIPPPITEAPGIVAAKVSASHSVSSNSNLSSFIAASSIPISSSALSSSLHLNLNPHASALRYVETSISVPSGGGDILAFDPRKNINALEAMFPVNRPSPVPSINVRLHGHHYMGRAIYGFEFPKASGKDCIICFDRKRRVESTQTPLFEYTGVYEWSNDAEENLFEKGLLRAFTIKRDLRKTINLSLIAEEMSPGFGRTVQDLFSSNGELNNEAKLFMSSMSNRSEASSLRQLENISKNCDTGGLLYIDLLGTKSNHKLSFLLHFVHALLYEYKDEWNICVVNPGRDITEDKSEAFENNPVSSMSEQRASNLEGICKRLSRLAFRQAGRGYPLCQYWILVRDDMTSFERKPDNTYNSTFTPIKSDLKIYNQTYEEYALVELKKSETVKEMRSLWEKDGTFKAEVGRTSASDHSFGEKKVFKGIIEKKNENDEAVSNIVPEKDANIMDTNLTNIRIKEIDNAFTIIDLILDCDLNSDIWLSTFQKSAGKLVSNGLHLDSQEVLHFCAANDREALMPSLVTLGASVNFADADGNTALHVAASLTKNASISVLMELGADKNIRNRKNETAYEAAISKLCDVMEIIKKDKIPKEKWCEIDPFQLEPDKLDLIKTESRKRNKPH